MSYWTAGSALGPVLGGILLESFWWGSVFLVGVPISVLLLVIAPVLLPESRNPGVGGLDSASVALSLASSVSETSTELGAALGIAILGTLGTVVYRHQIDQGIPSGVPETAAEAVRENIGAAASVSEGLPAPVGAGLLEHARDAFVTALSTVATAATVATALLAVTAVFTLRHALANPGPQRERPLMSRGRTGRVG